MAHLDEQGEIALEAALRQLRQRGTTVVIVSHKARILEAADRILVLREGRLLEYGEASTVMKKFRHPAPVPVKGVS